MHRVLRTVNLGKGASNTFLMESFVVFFASFNACGIPKFL